jgi:hypothetical protein
VRRRGIAGHVDDSWFAAARLVHSDPRLKVLVAMSLLVGLAVVPEGLVAPLALEIGASDVAVGWLLAVPAAVTLSRLRAAILSPHGSSADTFSR